MDEPPTPMALTVQLLSKALKIGPSRYEKEYVSVPMRDGISLVASHYSPKAKAASPRTKREPEAYPTVLIRTPYHRRHMRVIARWFTANGYHVILQDSRGRCDSEGEFDPVLTDKNDGHDTIRWIRAQPWFQQCPYIGTWGPSFLGIVQWAMLSPDHPADQPDAMVPMMSSSSIYSVLRPDNGIAFGLLLRWHYMTTKINAVLTL